MATPQVKFWKGDYEKIYKDNFSSLKLVKNGVYPYVRDGEVGNKDAIFLCENNLIEHRLIPSRRIGQAFFRLAKNEY